MTRGPESPGRRPLNGAVVAVVELVDDDDVLDDVDEALRPVFTARFEAASSVPPPPPLHAASATTIVATSRTADCPQLNLLMRTLATSPMHANDTMIDEPP